MDRKIPGINVQWPWSRLLIEGKKTVETRGYPIPEKYIGVELALIETPGPRGKKEAGITEARIIGTVKFSASRQYKSKEAWKRDFKGHCVPVDDPQYRFSEDKEKWGWQVSEVRPFRKPILPPKPRGIVFASSCTVPKV